MAPAGIQLPPTVAAQALQQLSPTPTKDIQNGVTPSQAPRPASPTQNGTHHEVAPAAEPKPLQRPTPLLIDRFIDEPRPLRVAVIGGGLAGVIAGVLLPKKVPSIELTIYEKNDDFVSLLRNIPPRERSLILV